MQVYRHNINYILEVQYVLTMHGSKIIVATMQCI